MLGNWKGGFGVKSNVDAFTPMRVSSSTFYEGCSANCSGMEERSCRSIEVRSSVIIAVFLHSTYLFICSGSALRCTLHLLFSPPLFLYLPSTSIHVNIIDDISVTFSYVWGPKKALISQIKHYQSGSFRQKARSEVFVVTHSYCEMCATICLRTNAICA